MSYLKKSRSAILAEQNINVVSSISSIYPNRLQLKTLLNVIWRLPKYVNQVGLLSRSTGTSNNKVVSSVDDAIDAVFRKSEKGINTYFALAGFKTPSNRLASNSGGYYGFWLSNDCSEAKAKLSKGYLKETEAKSAFGTIMCKVEDGNGFYHADENPYENVTCEVLIATATGVAK